MATFFHQFWHHVSTLVRGILAPMYKRFSSAMLVIMIMAGSVMPHLVFAQTTKWYEDIVFGLTQQILRFLETLVLVALWAISLVLGTLLSSSTFVNHELVRVGWSFIQGIVNIGFFLALIFLALLIVLRLEGGLGLRRILPRILIAALLVNFSLVIGGVIIDISRVIMATISQGIVGSGPDELGLRLITESELYKGVFLNFAPKGMQEQNSLLVQFAQNSPNDFLTTMKMGLVLSFSLLLLLAMIVVTVGFLVRYIALLLLLIISPAAYLAFALPQTQRFAVMWWSTFLKYVFYGPIAIFILALMARLNVNTFGSAATGLDIIGQGFLMQSAMLVLAILGNKAGTQLGNFASGAVVGYATGAARKTLGAAAGTGKVGAYLGAGLAGYGYQKSLGRTGFGQSLASGVGKVIRFPGNVKDVYKEGVEKRVNKALGVGDKSPSGGTLLARRQDGTTKDAIKAIDAGRINSPELNSDKLIKAAGGLKGEEINKLINALNAQRQAAETAADAARQQGKVERQNAERERKAGNVAGAATADANAARYEAEAKRQDDIVRDAEGRMTIVVTNKDAGRTIANDKKLTGDMLAGDMGTKLQERMLSVLASQEREEQAQLNKK